MHRSRWCDSRDHLRLVITKPGRGGGGGLPPYMCYIGMCRCEGYGFQAVSVISYWQFTLG